MKAIRNAMMGLVLIGLSGCAGLAQVDQSQLAFDRVVEVPGASKDKIYDGTRIWIAENFRSAKAVLEYENKESGTLIGNGNIKYPCQGMDCIAKSDWSTHFTMRVDTKDGKFKVAFSNLRISWTASSRMGAGDRAVAMQGELDDIKPALLAYGDQIAESINKGAVKSNW